MTTSRREATLRALFEQHATAVLAYALRHIGSADAQDIVSDVFVVAWRRIDDLPVADPLPWLLVVARNTIRNKVRGTARQRQVADGLANLQRSSTATGGADETAVERRAMLAALADLSPAEREAVLLTGWDGLSVSQAATVAGCSRRAFELRLHRARNRLRRHLASSDDHPGHRYPIGRPGLTQEAST